MQCLRSAETHQILSCSFGVSLDLGAYVPELRVFLSFGRVLKVKLE